MVDPEIKDFVEGGICTDSLMGTVVKVHPLLHGAIAKPGLIRFISYIPYKAIERIIVLEIRHEFLDKFVITRPVAAVSWPGRGRVCPVCTPNLVR